MKANEAPEKIYVQLPSKKWIGKTWNETPIKDGDIPHWENATNIEYVRTDAFIEKACEWLESVFKDLAGHYSGAELLEDFKNYMKGE